MGLFSVYSSRVGCSLTPDVIDLSVVLFGSLNVSKRQRFLQENYEAQKFISDVKMSMRRTMADYAKADTGQFTTCDPHRCYTNHEN